jgi:hypothetical protein
MEEKLEETHSCGAIFVLDACSGRELRGGLENSIVERRHCEGLLENKYERERLN